MSDFIPNVEKYFNGRFTIVSTNYSHAKTPTYKSPHFKNRIRVEIIDHSDNTEEHIYLVNMCKDELIRGIKKDIVGRKRNKIIDEMIDGRNQTT